MRKEVVLSACVLALIAIPAGAQEQPSRTKRQAVISEVHGVLECNMDKGGAPCGTERFTLTVQTDGSRTLRAHSQLPDFGMQIDANIQVDQGFRPLRAYANNYMGGKFLGAGFFAIEGDTMTASVQTPKRTMSEEIAVPQAFSLLLHPISGDGWHFGHYDVAKGGVQQVPRCTLGGAGESVRCSMDVSDLEFVAEETLNLPAGEFLTEHYRFGKDAEVWVHGPDKMVVQHVYAAFGTRYQLSELTTKIF